MTDPEWAGNPLIEEALGPYYVYLLIDPLTGPGEIFYVGKGTGWRFAVHLDEQIVGDEGALPEELSAKAARIATIRTAGVEPRVEFVRRQIATADEAYLVEAALIDLLQAHGSSGLTNAVRGHGSDLGLIALDELQEQVATPPLETKLRAILIKLGRWRAEDDVELPRAGYGYSPKMSQEALYNSTRAWWRLSLDVARSHPYAVAIYQGITRGIWEIDHAAWRTSAEGRVAFEGRPVERGEAAYDAFIDERGRRVPNTRGDGRSVFGSGQPVAYWR